MIDQALCCLLEQEDSAVAKVRRCAGSGLKDDSLLPEKEN